MNARLPYRFPKPIDPAAGESVPQESAQEQTGLIAQTKIPFAHFKIVDQHDPGCPRQKQKIAQMGMSPPKGTEGSVQDPQTGT